MLSDVPGVEGCALLGLHGGALVEMLREVGLVETRDVDHFPLGDVVLLHVALDHFGSPPGVLARQISTWLGFWRKMSGEKDSLFRAFAYTLCKTLIFSHFSMCPSDDLGREVRPKQKGDESAYTVRSVPVIGDQESKGDDDFPPSGMGRHY